MHKATAKPSVRFAAFTSLDPNAERVSWSIHQHWGIENKLHRALDVSFGEDLDGKRAGDAAQKFSLLKGIALNLLRQEKPASSESKASVLKQVGIITS